MDMIRRSPPMKRATLSLAEAAQLVHSGIVSESWHAPIDMELPMHRTMHQTHTGTATQDDPPSRVHGPPFFSLLNTYNKRETGGVGAEGKPHAGEESTVRMPPSDRPTVNE